MRRRPKRPSLRGSVRQSTVRMRAPKRSLYGVLMRLGLLLGTMVVGIILIFLLWHAGWPQRQVSHIAEFGMHLTQRAQFKVKDIVVEGRHETSKDAIYAALGVNQGAPILSFDPVAAQQRLGKLPWVGSAIVERRLPDTIIVRLSERVPMARWQHENKTVVIDGEGKPLAEARLDQFASLPLVVGADAPEETATLLTALKNYPDIMRVTTAAVRVGERRWDLHLGPKVIAKLPESDIDDALKRLSNLISGQKVLERDIVGIDLRLPDRLTIEPAAPAAHHGEAKL